MPLDIKLYNNHNLPPAYREVEELSKGKLELDEESSQAQCGVTDDCPQGIVFECPHDRERLMRYQQLNSLVFSSFAKIFEEELTKGHLMILAHPGFGEFFNTDTFAPFIRSALSSNEKVLEKLFVFLRANPREFSRFLNVHQQSFSSSQLDKLWQLFKSILDQIDPKWSSSERLKSRDRVFFSRNATFRVVSSITLRSFFSCMEASENLLDEAAIISPPGHLSFILRARVKDGGSGTFKFNVSSKAPPDVFKELQPELFAAKVSERNLDTQVVEMLLPGWNDDLESFLRAVKSLSAEPLAQ